MTQGQVENGISEAASVYGNMDRIGQRFDTDYTGTDAADEFVGGLQSARRKRERLANRETALFGGSGGSAAFGSGRDAGSF